MPKVLKDGKREYLPVRYSFSADELRRLGATLAEEVQEGLRILSAKSSAMKAFAAQIEQNEDRKTVVASKIAQGYEMRDMECLVYYCDPRPGVKKIVRADNGETVDTVPMTPEEMQIALPYEDGKPS